jgi:hypothetical protein
MQPKIRKLLGIMGLLSALCAWTSPALAYRAPYADSEVTVTTENVPGTNLIRVRHTIHDPVRNQDVTAESPAFSSFIVGCDAQVKTGIISFGGNENNSNNNLMYVSVYDPVLGKWVTDITYGIFSFDFERDCGIFAFTISRDWGIYGKECTLYVKTYDPASGAWKVFSKSALGQFYSFIKDGIVGYKQNWFTFFNTFTNIGMAVYDPRDGAWHAHEDSNNDGDLTV